MKKLIYSLIIVSILTVIWCVLFELSICYPEHGTDGIGFCANNRLVYELWKNGDLLGYLLFVLSACVIVVQAYTFNHLVRNKFGVSSFFLSLVIPFAYTMLILLHGEITYMPSELPNSAAVITMLFLVIVLSQIVNFGIWLFRKK